MSDSDSDTIIPSSSPVTGHLSRFFFGGKPKRRESSRRGAYGYDDSDENPDEPSLGADDSDRDPDFVLPEDNSDSDENTGPSQGNTPVVSVIQNTECVVNVNVNIPAIPSTSRDPNPISSTSRASLCDTPRSSKKVIEKRGRSAKLNVGGWEKTVAKRKRNRGEAYISYQTKKMVQAQRKLGPPCGDGCFQKLTPEKLQDILDAFWDIGDFDKQNAYIAGCITEQAFKRKYTKKQASQRQSRVVFSVMHSGETFNVCRIAFCSMHGIKRTRVERVAQKKRAARTGTPPKDMRGRRPNPRKIVGEVARCVHEHIQSLAVTSSHYSRLKNPHRQYLVAAEQAKTIKHLYSSYHYWMHSANPGVQVVRLCYYRRIFTTCYNIAFAPPKQDVCNMCLQMENEIKDMKSKGQDTAAKEACLLAHKEKAKIPKDLLKFHCKNRTPGVRVIAIDLQQTIPFPKTSANKAYYLRKLWMYNFCVYDTETGKSHMFLWNETQGSRGAAEIGSCILQWLQSVYEEPFRHLKIFADNCGGQNKNIHIVLLLLKQIHSLRLNSVDLIFMVSGHSYLPCDRSFGVIEKAMRQFDEIDSQEYLLTIMKGSMAPELIEVHLLDKTYFKDIKVLLKSVTRRNVAGQFKKASQICLSINESSSYRIKQSYNQENDSSDIVVRLEKGRITKARGRPSSLSLVNVQLPQKYLEDRMLQPAKVRDLKTLLSVTFNRSFLENLIRKQEELQQDANLALHEDDEDYEEDEHDSTTWDEALEEVRQLRENP